MVMHSDTEMHYVNLNSDKKNTAIAQNMRYPFVFYENNGYRFSNNNINIQIEHDCYLTVVEHVSDTADYAEIEKVLSKTSTIINDIFARMINDKKSRSVKCVLGFDISNIQVEPIENKDNALYGWVAKFTMPETYCTFNNNFNE
jgi:hypothetical protein